MATPSDTLMLRSPHQAQKVHATSRNFGKQRHQFLVKFMINGSQAGADHETMTNLTFVAKMVDRPKIDPKTEELHQYNKRRQIYTGVKYQPVRIQFYDDNQGLAQAMWKDYSSYYFGDFLPEADTAYSYDVTHKEFDPNGTGFGLKAQTGQQSRTTEAVQIGQQHNEKSISAQYYFSAIVIYHLYGTKMDTFTLTNPRISVFEPDDLDYENSGAAMISMSVVYENLQYKLQEPTTEERTGDIFAPGSKFDGDVMPAVGSDTPQESRKWHDFEKTENRYTGTAPTFAPAEGRMAPANDYRYNSTAATGSLGMFGNFRFGPNSQGNLGQMALNNSSLAAALNMGIRGNPLALNAMSMLGAANASRRGIDGAAYDVAYSRVTRGSTGFGTLVGEVITSTLASAAIRSVSSLARSAGLVLTPQGYGVMNSRQSGTAQYGFNPNTAPDGSSWGYTGPAGYQGPYKYYNEGPYPTDRPSGLYGRTGVEPKPLDDDTF